MRDKIRSMPKVELHLHLDGSVSLDIASKLSGLSTDEIRNKMIADDKCNNLSEYLTKFDFPISVMQSKENLIEISRNLVDYLEKENVVYAEVRFAPMFHVREGLNFEEVVEAVLSGLNSNDKVKTNLILCMMRGMDRDDNIKTIEVASKFLGNGVVGIDLAGAEDKYLLDEYMELFDIVKKRGIPFTIHAGENGGYEEVRKAIEIGAWRVGHGIHAISDDDTIDLIKEKGVLLELCPTSNVQTNAICEYKDHPIRKFYDMGVMVSVNTDNVTVSNVSISDEYEKLVKWFNFDVKDFNIMNKNAIKKSFLSEVEKIDLLNKYFK